MKCAKCNYESVPEGAGFCPNCGQKVPETSEPPTQITVTQEVGTVKDGEVTGVALGEVKGKVTIRSTVNQIEKKIVHGDYVERQAITNNILVLGPQALDEIAKRIAGMQGVGKQTLQNLEAQAVPENVSRQITEVIAAQKEVSSKGLPISAQASYQMGMLAAYDRKYDDALEYFRKATQADFQFSDAFEATAWLQQSRAMHDIDEKNYDSALDKLTDALVAVVNTDPMNLEALALRGYIYKSMGQVADRKRSKEEKKKNYERAAQYFEFVARLDPENASAQNGLGNIQHALGNLDAAIKAYSQAIRLLPTYTAAYHDLSLAYEDKMKIDRKHARDWCEKALRTWRKAYRLAPKDPGFSEADLLRIGQSISWLEGKCGKPKKKNRRSIHIALSV